MSKEDFKQRRDDSNNIEAIGKWIQERVYLLFNMHAFSWANHLKHLILKMIVWHEMVRKRVKRQENLQGDLSRIRSRDRTCH